VLESKRQRILCSVVRRGENGLRDFKLSHRRTGRRIRLHNATYCMKLGTGWWPVLIVENAARWMVRWGERWDERCEDERARQPVLRTPGSIRISAPGRLRSRPILVASIHAARASVRSSTMTNHTRRTQSTSKRSNKTATVMSNSNYNYSGCTVLGDDALNFPI
jgi:hypothetical protein